MEPGDREVQLFMEHRKFVLTTHISSDGDGVGSQLALARGLRWLGREVAVVNPTPVPANLAFLLRSPSEIKTPQDLADPERPFEGALTVVLDMGAFDRLGAVFKYVRASEGLLVIDHHRMEKAAGVHYLLDTQACATGEVTARLLDILGIPLTLDIAEPLYAAIYTDTGGFRYPGTTPATHALAGRLLEAGVDTQRIHTEIFERQRPQRLRLTGRILSTLEVSPRGKVAWMAVRRSMLDEVGANWDDADDLVNYTLQVDGVQAGFYFKELDTGLTKVSCRSRGDFSVDEFVSKWGGGGHPHAAGVRVDVPIDEAIRLLIPAAIEKLEGGE
jgi:phosphoesterase RecJ-like protein